MSSTLQSLPITSILGCTRAVLGSFHCALSNNKPGQIAHRAPERLRQAAPGVNIPNQSLTGSLNDIQEETECRLRGSGHEGPW